MKEYRHTRDHFFISQQHKDLMRGEECEEKWKGDHRELHAFYTLRSSVILSKMVAGREVKSLLSKYLYNQPGRAVFKREAHERIYTHKGPPFYFTAT